MSYVLPVSALEAARAHALREYPKEACGLVVDGVYLSCFNYATEPTHDFIIAPAIWQRAHDAGQTIEAVVHSHPDGPLYPSPRDMQGQLDTAVPWVILPTNGEMVGAPIVWDAYAPPAPLIGRTFVHGITDCYSLIRDAYRLGRERMAAEGVTDEWPMPPVELPEQPRADGWWDPNVESAEGKDLYLENFERAGFRRIARDEVRPGDVFLVKIKSKVCNHGGVYIGHSLILHHTPNRASRREPIGIWARAIDGWLRHEASDRAEAALQESENA